MNLLHNIVIFIFISQTVINSNSHIEVKKLPKHAGHDKHLCKIIVGDMEEVEKIKRLVYDPKYICGKCGRAANKEENLCEPQKLVFDIPS